MTEQEWLECTAPQDMLVFLQGRASERKLRLFAVACCSRIWNLFIDRRAWKAVEFAERYADGLATTKQLHECAWGRANEGTSVVLWDSWDAASVTSDYAIETSVKARMAWDKEATTVRETAFQQAWLRGDSPTEAQRAADAVVPADWLTMRESVRSDEQKCQTAILRCIFGNPFRPVAIHLAWLAWNNDTVQKIAQAIYDERGFDRMPILADALEEASCSNQDILTHCRQQGEHVRGCWVVDLLLGKE